MKERKSITKTTLNVMKVHIEKKGKYNIRDFQE